MTHHAKYGGSTAARTIGCPAWIKLTDALPSVDQGVGVNTAADEGTLLHNCMEKFMLGDIETFDVYALIGVEKYNGITLTIEMVEDKLNPAIDALLEFMDDNVIFEYRCEPYVSISKDVGGSIDLLAVSDDGETGFIIDYKFGYVDVDPIENAQLLFYTLCATLDPDTSEMLKACKHFTGVIIQPNGSGDDLKYWNFDAEHVDQFETQLLEAIEQAERGNPEPSAGKHCKYCPAEALCPIKTGTALVAKQLDLTQATNLAAAMMVVSEMESWCKSVKKLAHEQLELGVAVEGWKLVNKRAVRTWNDPAAVEDKIRKARKIKLEQGFELKLKSPPQLEKVCKELGVDFKQYDTYISSVSSGTTLASASDKRKAALPLQKLAALNAMNKKR